ncbi:MAG: S8 family serine peptidase, partial [Planctomycetota bacterium]|nr:S8 family serine peptidase [Planctomycetota bacterium]
MLSAIGLNSSPDTASVDDLRVDFDEYHSSRIIVKFDNNMVGTRSVSVGKDHFAIGRPVGSDRALRQVHVPTGMPVETALQKFKIAPGVEFAELDFKVNVTGTPDDPSFSQLWGLHNTGQTGGSSDADIDALEAWDITVGSSSTIVAVIDTGVDYTHPDLIDNMWINTDEIAGNGIDDDGNGYTDDIYGYDFYDNDGDPMDTGGHGTHVAGTIGAQGDNGVGIVGVNWEVQIMALRFLGPQGGYTSDAVSALNYAVDNGATISNNSWGGGGFSSSLYNAIQNARDNGHIFVAAAGNDYGNNNDSNPHYPSNYDLDNVISVASTTHTDALSGFSNVGATTVDLAAPGSSIYSTLPGNSYGTYSGTSMATPHVAGVVALVKSHYPNLGYQEIIDRIYDSVDVLPNLSGLMVTGGRLNAAGALAGGGEAPGIQVTPTSGLQTSESGGSASFEVKLQTAPTANVTIDVSTTDGTEGTASISQLTFTPTNWDVAQTVTVTGQDDSDLDGNVAYSIELAPAVSSDPAYNGLDPEDVQVTNLDNEVAAVDFYFSVGNNRVQVGDIVVDNEDIVARTTSGDYEVVFDGSDLGLGGVTIDAFSVVSDDTILLSFSASASISGLGTVDDSDILQFVGTFGTGTSGSLSMFFDGSDVGLTRNGEDVDALKLLDDNTLLVSTSGSFSVSGASGADEDLILFSASSFGANTQGSWSIYFDGSDVGLSTSSSEDVDAVAIDDSGNILLSTRGNFSVSGVSGADEDVFVFLPTTTGSNTSGSFDTSLYFDGSQAGLAGTDIFAIDIPTVANEAPTAGDDSYSMTEDDVLSVGAPGVLANDSDPEGSSLTAVLVSGPSNGSLTLNSDGSFTYEPDADYFGSDSFQYRANDGVKNSAAATVTITIDGVNDAPVAEADTYSTNQDETLDVSAGNGVLSNDSDVDDDDLSAILVSGTSNGTLTLSSDGSFSYVPDAGFTGSDSFTYQANDGQLDSDPVTVQIEVAAQSGTKFFVVDTSADDTFEYDASGNLVENYALAGSVPRGITTTADGSRAWVIDNNDNVYVYDDAGNLLGNWYADGLSRPEGIALDGDDLLIVDRGLDAVLRYTGGALRFSGSQSYDTGFYLVRGNGNPRGITTDGYNIWVVNDTRGTDRVYAYSDDAI